ncbi:MAG: glutaredoxin family protein [Pyrinomonadaceae bacterium]
MNDQPSRRVRVCIYTRPGCHLCEEAKAEMARADCADLFTLEEIDINTDPDLVRCYGYDIPVVTINGAHAFKHRLVAADFRRELQQALDTGTS